ncbi:MAG: hypothetical protein ABSE48_12675 [Verrucomicrobiota bacterium]|jgi:hypothetical protein
MWWNKWVQRMHSVAPVILISAFVGCKRDEVKVYRIEQNESPQMQSAPVQPETTSSGMGMPQQPATLPQVNYQLPEGWQEKLPTEMRVASLTALGPNGESADVSVIPLPIVGQDLDLINMWRSQVQLPATTDPAAVKQAEPVAVGTEEGRLFNFVSEQPMIGQSRQRILVAELTRGTMSWFFKMTGGDEFVTSQKGIFLKFLKSISFVGSTAAEIAGVLATQNENANSIWTVPSDWQRLPPSQFLFAEFSITGTNGANADVNVAQMGGDGGGWLANANRWRGQLGLPQIAEADLSMLATTIDSRNGKIQLVDFNGTDAKTGKPTRLVGAVVPQNGQTWFYKLMGDETIVAQQKDAFIKFIQSANYANAP